MWGRHGIEKRKGIGTPKHCNGSLSPDGSDQASSVLIWPARRVTEILLASFVGPPRMGLLKRSMKEHQWRGSSAA